MTGYILYKKKMITNVGSKELSAVLVHLIIPCVIIKSYAVTEFSMEKLQTLGIMFIITIVVLLTSMVVSYFIFGTRKKIENFSSAFSSAGFMGIPLVHAVFGEEAVFYMAVFVALLNIFQWTYGLVIMTGDTEHIKLKKIITNPVLIGLFMGFVNFLIPFDIPEVIISSINYIGAMNTPVAMLVLGVYLAQTDMISMFQDKNIWVCSFSRLILIPLLTLLILCFLPETEVLNMLKQVVLIAAAAPVGSNVAVFAQLYNQKYDQAVKVVCVSTILCIITMPFVMYVAEAVF